MSQLAPILKPPRNLLLHERVLLLLNQPHIRKEGLNIVGLAERLNLQQPDAPVTKHQVNAAMSGISTRCRIRQFVTDGNASADDAWPDQRVWRITAAGVGRVQELREEIEAGRAQ